MTTFSLQDTIAVLTRTPAALDALLRGLPEGWTHRDEGDQTWSPFGVVGHLIHIDRTDWLPRIRRVLEFGEAKPFDPVDRVGHVKEIEGKTLAQLLDEFAALRAGNIRTLQGMDIRDQDFERRGRHPALGPVTLSQVLATWAAHDLSHLHQIARVMAYQYRETVGPWSKYLGVMQCAGHSA